MTWLDGLIEKHKEYESPTAFWWWSGLTAISAILKDNVWINRGALFNLYPNIYTILYADSGLKKGAPINMAKRLVKGVDNTKIISGRSSIQGILKRLGTAESKPGGIIDKKAHGFICASELAASLVSDDAALTILTDLYDRNFHEDDYESLLKMEFFSLKDPTVSLLGGINEAHAEVMFQNKDIKGGYIGRSFIIHENKRATINSLIYEPALSPNYHDDILYLKEIAKLRGGFEKLAHTPAGKYYDEWYHEFIKAIDLQQVRDTTGTLNRFSESVMKVIMLLQLSKSPTMIIELNTVIEAIQRCEILIGNVRKTTMSQGKSQWANEKALLIQELLHRDNHMITRTQLLHKYWMHANADEWDKIIETMVGSGNVKVGMLEGTNQVAIEMPQDVVEKWMKHLGGK